MNNRYLSSKFSLACKGFFAALMIVAAFFVFQPTRAAGPTNAMHGYAWSSTIGWISLNCAEGGQNATNVCATSNYAVTGTVSQGGVSFDGYAWSSNIGWISFKMADVNQQCGGPAALYFPSNQVRGWARAIAGNPNQGWDGCINFGNIPNQPNPAYGVIYNPNANVATPPGMPGHALTGNAWGDVNVGWIGFTNATLDITAQNPNNGALTLTSNTLTVPAAASVITLTWTTQNIVSLGSSEPTPHAAAPYALQWEGPQALANTPPDHTKVIHIDANLTNNPVNHTYLLMGSDGNQTYNASVTVVQAAANAPACMFMVNGQPAITYNIGDPNPILSWQVQNMAAGSLVGSSSGNFTGWTGNPANSTKQSTPNATYTEVLTNVTTTRTYSLSNCLPAQVTITIPAPSCAIVPDTSVIPAPAAAPVNGVMHLSGLWNNIATFPAINVTAAAPNPNPFGVQIGAITGSPLNNAQAVVNIPISSTQPVTSTQTIHVNTTPDDATLPSCAPATIYIVPPNMCQDPLATNVGQPLPCTYPVNVTPTTHRPPWQEF